MPNIFSVFKILKKSFYERSRSSLIFWFLFKTLLYYFVLNNFFIAYTGIIAPGGRLYSFFFREHADFIGAFRRFLLWGGSQFAELIGYPSSFTDYTLIVSGGPGVRMVYSCLGFSLMSACAALVLAWPSRWLHRVIGMSSCTAVIIGLNMVRLGGLAVLYSTGRYGFFEYINHHDLFNIIMLVLIFIMFAAYVKFSALKEVE